MMSNTFAVSVILYWERSRGVENLDLFLEMKGTFVESFDKLIDIWVEDLQVHLLAVLCLVWNVM